MLFNAVTSASNPMRPKAYSYIRTSKDGQLKGESLRRQMARSAVSREISYAEDVQGNEQHNAHSMLRLTSSNVDRYVAYVASFAL